jgi:hypothetical protein
MKKQYRVSRSIFGDLGSLKRRAVLTEDDPRIVANPTAFNDLVKRKLLVEEDADAEPAKSAAKAKPAKAKEGSVDGE